MIGQYFTPPIVAETILELVGYRGKGRLIDPACGEGIFLQKAAEEFQCGEIIGWDIDPRLIEANKPLAKDKVISLRAVDALEMFRQHENEFDFAVGNPPFSAQAHLVKGRKVLSSFDLGFGRPSQCLEVLFLELFIRLLKKEGGHFGIILPEGIVSNSYHSNIRKWLLYHTRPSWLISLPRNIFTGTAAKAIILIAERLKPSHASLPTGTRIACCAELTSLLALAREASSRKPPMHYEIVDLRQHDDWRPEYLLSGLAAARAKSSVTGVRLGDIATLRTGFARYGLTRELYDQKPKDGLVLIRAKNIRPQGGLQLDKDVLYIRRASPMFRSKAVVKPGEILFVRVGVACCGRVALVPRGLEAQADDWIHIISPHPGVSSKLVYEWLRSEAGQAEIARLSKGVGTVSISKTALSQLVVPGADAQVSSAILEKSGRYSKRKR